MLNNYKYKNLNWIDASSPTRDELSSLIEKYDLHSIIGEELFEPTKKPKIEIYDNYIFLALHIPSHNIVDKKRIVTSKEIDFVISKEYIITSHDEIIEPLHEFAKVFETNTILDKKGIGNHAGVIFYYIIKKLYDRMSSDLENIKDALSDAEKHIFNGNERKMVEVLSDISRELIDFKQITHLHKDILESFEKLPSEFFGKNFKFFIDDISNSYNSIHSLIISNKELLSDLRETNDSLLTTKQNENLKMFSILAFITFPLTLFLNLFMIPTSHTPILGNPYDWEIIVSVVVLTALLMLTYFKQKDFL